MFAMPLADNAFLLLSAWMMLEGVHGVSLFVAGTNIGTSIEPATPWRKFIFRGYTDPVPVP
jgi:hypothetical protein